MTLLRTNYTDHYDNPVTPSTLPETYTIGTVNDWGNGIKSDWYPAQGYTVAATINGVAATFITDASATLTTGQIRVWYAHPYKTGFWECASADNGKTLVITDMKTYGAVWDARQATIFANKINYLENALLSGKPTAPEIELVSAYDGTIKYRLKTASTSFTDGTLTTYTETLDGVETPNVTLNAGDVRTVTASNNTSHTIYLKATDSQAKISDASNTLTAVPQVSIPTAPVIALGTVGDGSITYSLTTASTDGKDGTITSYREIVDSASPGTLITLAQGGSRTVSSLTNSVSHSIQLKAVDSDGNLSSGSNSISGTPQVSAPTETIIINEACDGTNGSTFTSSGLTNLQSATNTTNISRLIQSNILEMSLQNTEGSGTKTVGIRTTNVITAPTGTEKLVVECDLGPAQTGDYAVVYVIDKDSNYSDSPTNSLQMDNTYAQNLVRAMPYGTNVYLQTKKGTTTTSNNLAITGYTFGTLKHIKLIVTATDCSLEFDGTTIASGVAHTLSGKNLYVAFTAECPSNGEINKAQYNNLVVKRLSA